MLTLELGEQLTGFRLGIVVESWVGVEYAVRLCARRWIELYCLCFTS